MKNIIGSKLAKLRLDNNMRQEDMAKALSEISNDACHLSTLTISSYENGTRTPPLQTLVYICRYFNISLDWLCGLTETETLSHVASTDEGETELKPYKEIKLNELKKYDKQPVYVLSTDGSISPGWAIVSYANRRFIFADKAYTFASNLKILSYPPKENQYSELLRRTAINRSQLNTAEVVWVEMIVQDPYIRGQYNGWYYHNENHTALINKANGLVLTYEGLGISYTAYSQK